VILSEKLLKKVRIFGLHRQNIYDSIISRKVHMVKIGNAHSSCLADDNEQHIHYYHSETGGLFYAKK